MGYKMVAVIRRWSLNQFSYEVTLLIAEIKAKLITGGPRYSRGVTFLETVANTKTADNKGALFSPKSLVFEAK